MPIHHPGKDEDKGMRGSSALLGAADAVWQISLEDDGRHRINVEKMKDGPNNQGATFKLKPRPLGVDEDNDEISTLVVEVGKFEPDTDGDTKKPIPKKKSSDEPIQLDKVYITLRVLAAQKANESGKDKISFDAVKISKSALIRLFVDNDFIVKGNPESSRQALNVALKTLVDDKKIKIEMCGEEETYTLASPQT
jgi:hypothetical protein